MKKRYLAEEQKKYINGLKRYESRGIPIYIDGEMPNDSDGLQGQWVKWKVRWKIKRNPF